MQVETALFIFIVTQLMTFAALRQQVKDLAAAMIEEKIERQKLATEVQALKVEFAPLAVAKKTGG
jgi:hypothetical protein